MKNSLQISMLQLDLHWENKDANLKKTEEWLAKCSGSDLVLLPEMFSTGFSMRPKDFAEKEQGITLEFLKQMSIQHGFALCTSIIVEEEGKYFNRLYFIKPDGSAEHYDKRHLFSLAGEEKHYTAGTKRLVVDYLGWRIMPLICYDLRFPVWSRNDCDYDLLLFVANWPERRSLAWKTLLTARAIENIAYVAGVNRCGTDGNQVFHSGDSAIYDPLGTRLAQASDGKEQLLSAELSLAFRKDSLEKFRFLEDRDAFVLA